MHSSKLGSTKLGPFSNFGTTKLAPSSKLGTTKVGLSSKLVITEIGPSSRFFNLKQPVVCRDVASKTYSVLIVSFS